MIHIVLGTKAQLIKMAPIMVRLSAREIPYRFIHTGQHQATMDEMLQEFGLRPPDLVLHRGRDIVGLFQMLIWVLRILALCITRRRMIFGESGDGVVLVHGDTFSTLLGALMGRVAGLRVGHVESGLRSFDLLHPFPEEITRLLTFRLSHVLYCPGAWAMRNVEALDREKVDTGVNTLSDTLALLERVELRRDHLPEGAFAIASLHRYENIFSHARFEELVGLLERIAEHRRILFILHPPTERQLARYRLRERLEANPAIELRPRYTYFDFVALLQRADFIVTDGGSIQEESSYLGIPCLLLRRSTERQEGLGENVLLSHYDREQVLDFVRDPERYRRAPQTRLTAASDVIIESALQQHDSARGSAQERGG